MIQYFFILKTKIPGNKDLIVEKCIVGPINISIDYPTLKEQGINRICTLDSDVKLELILGNIKWYEVNGIFRDTQSTTHENDC